jgi:hypothetical protein
MVFSMYKIVGVHWQSTTMFQTSPPPARTISSSIPNDVGYIYIVIIHYNTVHTTVTTHAAVLTQRFFCSHNVSSKSTEDITQAIIADTSSQLSQCKAYRLLDMAVQKFYKLCVHIRTRFLTEQVNLQSQYASKSAHRTVIKLQSL